jgi:hypothetical protein
MAALRLARYNRGGHAQHGVARPGGRRHGRGCVNVYAARPQAFTPELETVISLLGAMATAMLLADREEGRAESLERALRTSRRIGMALGILMATTQATPDDAWELLSRESMNRNIRVSTLAEQVITTGTFDTRGGD